MIKKMQLTIVPSMIPVNEKQVYEIYLTWLEDGRERVIESQAFKDSLEQAIMDLWDGNIRDLLGIMKAGE